MSELKRASARLERAIDRLDRALANGRPSAQGAPEAVATGASAAAERERESLRADLDSLRLRQAHLERALRDARERQARMRQTNDAVAERLDDAIGSLRAILGS